MFKVEIEIRGSNSTPQVVWSHSGFYVLYSDSFYFELLTSQVALRGRYLV